MEAHELCPGCMCRVTEEQMQNGCPYCGYRLPMPGELAPHILAPRTVLEGKYMIGKMLGAGGCGITYLGYDLNLELRIAIKEYYPVGFVSRDTENGSGVISGEGDKGVFFSDGKKKFIQEARMLARFSGLRNIVSVRDYFEENNTGYIIMEYLDGETLKSYLIRKGGRISCGEVMRMLQPLLTSLNAVHEQGMIHRDISPDNIMILKDGTLKLLDFGSARDMAGSAERSASVMLKPGYAPEEQYRMYGRQGTWTDVYALCATIYRCLTGHTPVDALSRKEHDTLIPPSQYGAALTPQQEAALLKGMAVDAEQRFKTIGEFYRGFYCNEIPMAQGGSQRAGAAPNGTQWRAGAQGSPQQAGFGQNTAWRTGNGPQNGLSYPKYQVSEASSYILQSGKKKRSRAVLMVSVPAAAIVILIITLFWAFSGKRDRTEDEAVWSQDGLARGESGTLHDSGQPAEDDGADGGNDLQQDIPEAGPAQAEGQGALPLPNGLSQNGAGGVTPEGSLHGFSQSPGGGQIQESNAPQMRYEIPDGFVEVEKGFFCAPDYPSDTSNINVMTAKNDTVTFQYTEELFCYALESLLDEYYDMQVDVECTEFTKTTINGYNALIIRIKYDLQGVALEQIQCSVETEKDTVTTITMSQPAGSGWADAFDRVLDSIYIE
ncbi:MAG: serine/threonine protein kinase [Clostridium sp.]|nr:serine/threonine protein kinase [Clostridium sp.]